MMKAGLAVGERTRFRVRRDLRTIKKVLRRVRHSEHLANYCLFGRRTPAQLLDYVDSRVRKRGPLQLPIYVAAAEFDGRDAEVSPLQDGEMLAITKDVSLRGVGFTHELLFEGDYALVTFDLMDVGPVSLLVEIRWSNRERGPTYMTGGRFVGIPVLPANGWPLD